jgi:ABC-type nitrate/sulfonate/bicarbonate transport system substrate-binding protein
MPNRRVEVAMGKSWLGSTTAGLSTLLALTTIVLAGGISAQAADVVRYGIDDDANINRLPQVVAEREGLFAREGVEVQTVVYASSFRPLPGARPISLREAMDKGEVDMQRQQFPLLINDVMAGSKAIGIAVTSANPYYVLLARPEIKTFADLKGKTITITAPRDGITLWTRKLLALHGIGDSDATLKRIAGSEGRLMCVKSGECAAASLGQPQILDALAAGIHVLGVNNEVPTLMYQVDIANPAWAAAHRDSVIKYIRATTAAMRFIIDAKNRDEVVKVTAGYMKESNERARAMLEPIWDPKNRVLPQRAAFDMDSIKGAIALMGEYGVLQQPLPPPERFIDPQYAAAVGG